MKRDQVIAPSIHRDGDWLAALDALGVEFLVLDIQRDAGLLQLVRSQPGWIVEFQDGEAALFARAETPRGTQATA